MLCKLIPQTALDDPSQSDQIHVDHSVTSRKPYVRKPFYNTGGVNGSSSRHTFVPTKPGRGMDFRKCLHTPRAKVDVIKLEHKQQTRAHMNIGYIFLSLSHFNEGPHIIHKTQSKTDVQTLSRYFLYTAF